MTAPFQAVFLPTGETVTVESVTDSSAGRFYWVRSKHGVLVHVHRRCFGR